MSITMTLSNIRRCVPSDFASYLPAYAAEALAQWQPAGNTYAHEIRLRRGQPIVIMTGRQAHFLCENHWLTGRDIREVFEKICDHSVYSYQNELANGFVTLPGGHRAGICGTAATDSNGNRTLRYVSSINIRIANEYIGCASSLSEAIFSRLPAGSLIVGAPGSGKTTLLRDIALSLSSSAYRQKVTVVDERGEIAAMHRGEPQHTLGPFCDVLNGYPKGEGILIALRTLSPDVIVCDEIGGEGDAEAVCEGLNAGVAIISSIHACDVDELYRRKSFQTLRRTGAFGSLILLKPHEIGVVDRIIEVNEHDA